MIKVQTRNYPYTRTVEIPKEAHIEIRGAHWVFMVIDDDVVYLGTL